jgi:hypothetical protein
MFKKPSATKWHRRTAPVAKPGEPLSLMEIKNPQLVQQRRHQSEDRKALWNIRELLKFFFERIYIKLRVRAQGNAVGNGFGKGYLR